MELFNEVNTMTKSELIKFIVYVSQGDYSPQELSSGFTKRDLLEIKSQYLDMHKNYKVKA